VHLPLQIAELGSMTRAAAFLHIAQPALLRQMQQLEDEIGRNAVSALGSRRFAHFFGRSALGVAQRASGPPTAMGVAVSIFTACAQREPEAHARPSQSKNLTAYYHTSAQHLSLPQPADDASMN